VSASHDQLTDARYVTIILRLVISPPDQIRGEMTDAADKSSRRFAGWHGLTRALRDWLNERFPDLVPSDQPAPPDRSERS
jgi:hypothetical protein